MKNNQQTPPHVLLADDERIVLATLTPKLEEAGFIVSQAEGGQQAIDLAMSVNPDIAVLDINMPDISGLKVAEKLSHETNCYFIFLTAHADNEIVQMADSSRTLGYLVKPVSSDQLLPSIYIALQRISDIKSLESGGQIAKETLSQSQDIHVAIGLLMSCYKINRSAAYDRVRSYARNNRMKIHRAAKTLIEAHETLCQTNL